MDGLSKIRWTVKVSKETDVAVRGFLAQRGLKKGDISKFVEEAVRWRVLDQTVAEARASFSDLRKGELESLVAEAIQSARTRTAKARKTHRPRAS